MFFLINLLSKGTRRNKLVTCLIDLCTFTENLICQWASALIPGTSTIEDTSVQFSEIFYLTHSETMGFI